jgi:hypothetical protein
VKGNFIKKNGSLLPVGDEAHELLQAIKDGKECTVEIHVPRNAPQLRMFFALCEILADNDPKCPTKDIAKQNLLWALNYVDLWIDRGEKAHVQVKSISFESMKQEEFNQFFQRALELIGQWLGTAPEEIKARVYEITNPLKGYTVK